MAAADTIHRGDCHCGHVRFEMDAPAIIDALGCDCSICQMTGSLHLIVPAAHFRLLAGEDALVEYRSTSAPRGICFAATAA